MNRVMADTITSWLRTSALLAIGAWAILAYAQLARAFHH